ncbi:Ig-like domain-containing protein [Cohnella cholangitidis]|uniref:Invasin domain-containing protein n=1 Tax=Cohnella cholangitidis TaxID=2598458 RepID=A0A7G5C6Y0_9BACL|nr:hypothetical protein FPL14_10020 [Cohnella cholangitidis]
MERVDGEQYDTGWRRDANRRWDKPDDDRREVDRRPGQCDRTGGATVGIASTLGTVSAVTDNNNGTYTATLTAPMTTGTATISATVGGSAIGRRLACSSYRERRRRRTARFKRATRR